jgi:hypothetical protein
VASRLRGTQPARTRPTRVQLGQSAETAPSQSGRLGTMSQRRQRDRATQSGVRTKAIAPPARGARDRAGEARSRCRWPFHGRGIRLGSGSMALAMGERAGRAGPVAEWP